MVISPLVFFILSSLLSLAKLRFTLFVVDSEKKASCYSVTDSMSVQM